MVLPVGKSMENAPEFTPEIVKFTFHFNIVIN